MKEAVEWIGLYQTFWEERFEALTDYLERAGEKR
jgi:hypothetical protein